MVQQTMNVHEDSYALDDGSNIDYYFAGTKYFSIRKSDKQLLLEAGVSTDQTL